MINPASRYKISNAFTVNQGVRQCCPLSPLLFNIFLADLPIRLNGENKVFYLTHLGNKSHLYLYGHYAINFADNRKILLSTIEYIKKTSRF